MSTDPLTARPATEADLPAILDLRQRVDIAWHGAAEHDADEVAEEFALARTSRLLLDGDRLVAAALVVGTDTTLVVDPERDPAPAYAELLRWLESVDAEQLAVLDRNTVLLDALDERGWTYRYSAFDLRREYDGWTPARPSWPDGVTARTYRPSDLAATHRLVYVDARFADEPGHFPRELGEWQELFLTGRTEAELPLLALRGERIVGAAIGRIFSDGTGWINQLAVAGSERGTGIGTAVMAAYFEQLREHGTVAAGLGVMAANRGALRLYQSFGLEIVREFRFLAPPPRVG